MLFRRISWDRTCPECKSADVYRVNSPSLALRALCRVSSLRTRWCANCDTFFLSPKQAKSHRTGDPLGPTNLNRSGPSQPHASGPSH